MKHHLRKFGRDVQLGHLAMHKNLALDVASLRKK